MTWKKIPNHPNYEVNEMGKVRTTNYEHKGITKELKQSKNKKGYLRVNIDGKLKRSHRLIAMTFLSNYSEKLQVNHKNGIKIDNRIENLEMVTAKENSWHRNNILKIGNKPVIQKDKNGKIINKYISISEAERQTGIDHTCIINVCKNKQKTAGKFIWEYC